MMRMSGLQHTGVANSVSLTVDHDLTLLIPAYNEEARLPRTLRDAKAFLDDWGIDYRVIVIDNRSADRTGEIASRFGYRFSTIRQEIPGKGAAVRMGMLASRSRIVAFTDADLPFDLSCLRMAYEKINSRKCSVVFGSRNISGMAPVVQRSLMRTVASYVFRKLVSQLVSRDVTDTQCGLKVFSHHAARQIFSQTMVNGFAFDAEVIYITHLLSFPYCRVPVTLVNDEGSTVSLVRNAFPMLRDVLRVRWQALRGVYRLRPTEALEPEFGVPQIPLSKAA